MPKKRMTKKQKEVAQEAEQRELLGDALPHDDPEGAPASDVAEEAPDDVAEEPAADEAPEEAAPDDVAEEPAADEAPEEATPDDVAEEPPADHVPEEAASDRVAERTAEDGVPASPEAAPDDGPGTGTTPADDRLSRAKELVRDSRVDEAIALYRAILEENPANLKARNNLGVLYDGMGLSALALEQFDAAERLEPENVELLNNYGSALGAMGRYDAAEELLRRAHRLDPDSVAVRASIGILHFRRGIYAQAEVDLRWVCDHDAEHGPAFYYRGESLNRLGRFDEALEALEHAIELQPLNARAFYTLGHLYDRKHMAEEAALKYRRARELTRG